MIHTVDRPRRRDIVGRPDLSGATPTAVAASCGGRPAANTSVSQRASVCGNRQRTGTAYRSSARRCRAKLHLAMNRPGKTGGGFAWLPGLPVKLSRNTVVCWSVLRLSCWDCWSRFLSRHTR